MWKIIFQNIKKYAESIINKYEKWKCIISDQLKRNVQQEQLEYSDLTPSENLKNNSEYIRALEWAIQNKKITNIALAGPYGSGKSSIIQTYLKEHPSVKSITLSLATFFENVQDKDGNLIEELVQLNQDIEEGILKQLFYSVDYKKIPRSRYRKLHNISRMKIFLILNVLLVGMVVGICFFIPGTWSGAFSWIITRGNNLGIGSVGAFLIVGSLTFALIYIVAFIVWKLSTRTKIKEVNIADKVTVSGDGDTEEQSIFNKNMDEIVYFFEVTNFSVVFIEDLDRFKSAEIFIKLRDLNTVLNNYEMIKRKIVFVYAVKDDIFSDKDRTKFFDFIIPVVPIINATNSEELFFKLLQEKDGNGQIQFKHDISESYITAVSPYIDDMRVLLNIYNEFLIYKNTLREEQELKLQDEHIMSLVIFKNLFPKDFSDLQQEHGIVKKAFNDKEEFVKEQIRKIYIKIQQKEELLERIETDVLRDICELKAAMLYRMSGMVGFTRTITPRGEREYTVEQIMKDDFDLGILQGKYLTVTYRYGFTSYNPSTGTKTYSSIEELSNGESSYIERWEALKNNTFEKKEEIKREITLLEFRLHNIEEMCIKDLFKLYTSKEILSEKVCDNKLLVFMLRNGFIDENYASYINYFHANSITKEDKNFILGVRNHEQMNFSYKLTKVEQVAKRLLIQEFDQKEIYNFQLLSYLLKHEPESEKTYRFIKQLADEKDESWNFVDSFITRLEVVDTFIYKLGQSWVGMWDYIYNHLTLTEERKLFYFVQIMKYARVSDIVRMNCSDKIRCYFVENEDILNDLSGQVDDKKSIEIIRDLDIKFKKIRIEKVSAQFLKNIFDGNYYAITPEMFETFVAYYSPDKNEQLRTANYTTILEIDYAPVISYIQDNFRDYICNVVLKLQDNTKESEAAIIDILERTVEVYGIWGEDVCRDLISKENIILTDFEMCCTRQITGNESVVKQIWDNFLLMDKVKITWRNIILYLEYHSFSEILEIFLSKHMKELCDEGNHQTLSSVLVEKVLLSNITLEAFEIFILHNKLGNFDIPFTDFPSEKIKLLIKHKYFEFTPKNSKRLCEEFPELWETFIILNKETFLMNLSDYDVEDADIRKLILSEEFTDEEKVILISKLENGLDEDIAQLIYKMRCPVDKSVWEDAWKYYDEHQKLNVIISQSPKYSVDEIEVKLREIGGSYAGLAERGNRHEEKIPMSPLNYDLAKVLEKKGYLSSVEVTHKKTQDRITFEDKSEEILICRVRKKQ